jgi:hypothetical protein
VSYLKIFTILNEWKNSSVSCWMYMGLTMLDSLKCIQLIHGNPVLLRYRLLLEKWKCIFRVLKKFYQNWSMQGVLYYVLRPANFLILFGIRIYTAVEGICYCAYKQLMVSNEQRISLFLATYKMLPKIFLPGFIFIWESIGMDFDVIDEVVHQLFMGLKKERLS